MTLDRLARALAAAMAATIAVVAGTGLPAAADTIRDRQWHLGYLHAADLSSQGEGVTVAVIDTGVDANHPDLVGAVLPGTDLTGSGGDGRTDTAGHGTSMAALIAAHGHGPGNGDGVLGLAPKARILPIRTKADGGFGNGELATGIRWAVDHSAKILNVSQVSADSTPIREATEYALSKNVIIIAGNGNDGSFTVGAPAMYPGVIAVGGTDKNGQRWKDSTRGAETVLAAPAVDMVSASPGGKYLIGDGTSGSTAIVTATAALIWSKYPQLNANNVIQRLISTADHHGEPGRNNEYGYGIVNPLHALAADIPAVSANPLTAKPPTASSSPGQSPATTAVAAPSPAPRSHAALVWAGAVVIALLAVLAAGSILIARRRRNAVGPPPPSGWSPGP